MLAAYQENNHMPLTARRRIWGLLASVVLTGALLSFNGAVAAQDIYPDNFAPHSVGEATPTLTLVEVEAALANMEADAGIEDAVKALLRPKYQQAIGALKQAGDFAAQAADYRAALTEAPARSAELRASLRNLPSAEAANGASLEGSTRELQEAIEIQRAALDSLVQSLASTSGELTRVKARPFEISTRLPENQRELSDVDRELASPVLAEDATSPGRIAERILLRANESLLLSEADMLNQEQLSQSVREDLLQAQQELLKRRVENARATLDMLQELWDQRLASEAERVGLLADSMPDGIPKDDYKARALAAEVQALAQAFRTVVEQLQKVQTAQDELAARLERLNDRYEGVQEELQVSVGGSGMAQILLDMQRRFPNQRAYAENLMARLVPLDETRLAALQARRELRDQPDIESRFADHPAPAVAQLVNTRRDVLEQLGVQYGNLTRALAALEGDKQKYLATAEQVRAYAAEQLFGFGMRSAPLVGLRTLTDIPLSLGWFLRGEHWRELGRALHSGLARAPLPGAALVLLAAALLLARGRIGAALQRTGPRVRRISTDRYAHTAEALLWTTLLAIPVPLLIGGAAWALGQLPAPSAWLRGIAEGVQLVAWISLGLALLAEVCRPGGLGEMHFRWKQAPLARLRASVHGFAVVYLPALLITAAGVYEETAEFFSSVGRCSFILAQIWTAIVLWRLLNFSDGVLATFMREQPHSLIARWRYLWFSSLLLYPLALALVAGLGYIYTAIQLGLGLLSTAAYILGGTLLYRLARRWFRMRVRKLALAEALRKRRARQQSAAAQAQPESGDLVAIDPDAEQQLDLVTVDGQTGYLLRLFFSLAVATAILLKWSEQFPLIGALDGIAVPLADGLTLLGIGQGLLTVVVTYIAARNLPGLLELAVLRATHIDAGTRHAIATLLQYAVIAIGLILFFNVLEVDWAKLGWIAAALSVGIGFGLQEVVANFVCGLILLFERPIRVGDVVTVNNVTGTVTKIRIRATTITNGDRQAFVVPNKTLITGSLLNWTLNEPLNRITLRVGVARGTDTDQARQILLEVAADHPTVLKDPSPMAVFEEFGPGSRNLVLYAYLAALDNRSGTVTEMLTEIDTRFAAAGIEIPNPQMDINLHGGALSGS
jgi:potassium efflux system protein